MTIEMEPGLAEALEHCRRITQSQARNFFYGLKLTPEPKRSALYAVYAWMRKADDLVDRKGADESTMQDNVERFRAATDAALRNEPMDDDPIWIALNHVGQRFGLDRKLFHAMIDGQLEDLHTRRYETFAQLREYCYRVASTVGLTCITIWGYDDDSAPALAVERVSSGIEANGFDVFRGRTRLRNREKLFLTAKLWATSLLPTLKSP